MVGAGCCKGPSLQAGSSNAAGGGRETSLGMFNSNAAWAEWAGRQGKGPSQRASPIRDEPSSTPYLYSSAYLDALHHCGVQGLATPALLDGALEPGVLQGLACCGALCRVPAVPSGATLLLAMACICPSSLRLGVHRVCSTIGVLCRVLSDLP